MYAGVGPAVRAGDRHGDRVVARPVAQARIAAARDIAIANKVLDRRISGWSPAARHGREVLTRRIARAVAHRLQDDMFIKEIDTQLKRSEHQDDSSEERRVGKEGVSTCRSWRSTYRYKNKQTHQVPL